MSGNRIVLEFFFHFESVLDLFVFPRTYRPRFVHIWFCLWNGVYLSFLFLVWLGTNGLSYRGLAWGRGWTWAGLIGFCFFFIKPSLTVVVEGTFTHTDTRTHARGRGFFWGAWLRAERGPPPRRFNGRVGVSPCGGSPGLPATPRYLNKRRFGVGVVSFVFFYCSNKKKR